MSNPVTNPINAAVPGKTITNKPKTRLSPWWLLAAGASVVVGLVVTGVLRPPQRPQAAPQTAVATASDFVVSVLASGTLEANETRDLKPKTAGVITVLPQVGDRVIRGQVLIRLDNTSATRSVENNRLALQKAQAQLESQRQTQANNRETQRQTLATAQTNAENARRDVATNRENLAYQQRLLAVGGTSDQVVRDASNALAKAETNLRNAEVALVVAQNSRQIKANSDAQDLKNLELAIRQAEINLNNSQTDLANTKIYAPFDGVVSAVQGQIGMTATTGQTVLTLLDDRQVKLSVQIDETQIGLVKLGQTADVVVEAVQSGPAQNLSGTVTRISPSGTLQSNIAVFYATVTLKNPTLALRPGMSGEAEIIAKTIKDAVQVPRRAVQTVGNQHTVTLQTGDTTQTRSVKIGPDDGTSIVITSGVRAGEAVVLPSRQTKPASAGVPLP
jgi:HlyD family secretion protein